MEIELERQKTKATSNKTPGRLPGRVVERVQRGAGFTWPGARLGALGASWRPVVESRLGGHS